jgi:hypothetical protein
VVDYFSNDAHKRILSDLSELLEINFYKKLEISAD